MPGIVPDIVIDIIPYIMPDIVPYLTSRCPQANFLLPQYSFLLPPILEYIAKISQIARDILFPKSSAVWSIGDTFGL